MGGQELSVRGFPLPYIEPSAGSSLAFIFMPHIWFLDFALLAVLVHPVVSWAFRQLAAAPTWIPAILSVVGVVFLLAATLFHMMPTAAVYSIARRSSYWEYRPIWGPSAPYGNRTPSEFWFGTRK